MLISCPNCGKQVSDKAKKCVHCGELLAEDLKEEAEKKNYFTMTNAEEKSLMLRFRKEEGKHYRWLRRKKIVLRIFFCSLIASILLVIASIVSIVIELSQNEMEAPTIGLILLAGSGVGCLLVCICPLLNRFFSPHFLLAYKQLTLFMERNNVKNFVLDISEAEERKLKDLLKADKMRLGGKK